MQSLGIALGGGGAKGLAHILMLEALDELGIRPQRIAGTSIGAIIGALYASGVPASTLKERALEFSIGENGKSVDALIKGTLLKWFEFIDLPRDRSGLLSVDTCIWAAPL